MQIKNTFSKNIKFQGYDVTPLKALYVQGLAKPSEKRIFYELSKIAKKEGFDLFVNQNNTKLDNKLHRCSLDEKFSIWAQDRKAFIINKGKKLLLWNTKENDLLDTNSDILNEFEINKIQHLPRGGNYYLGKNKKNENWMIINSLSIVPEISFKDFGDLPTKKHLYKIFNISPKNLIVVDEFATDIDMVMRPIGFPYILINDYKLVMENLKKMKKKFPQSKELFNKLYNRAEKEAISPMSKIRANNIKILKKYGFKPIFIAGDFANDINFLNAIALQNKENKITYITNSTRFSCPEIEYLQDLFDQSLKNNVKNINRTYYISGGKHSPKKKDFHNIFDRILSNENSYEQNSIMEILGKRLGGIHCMCAEIPKFDK